MKLKELGPIVVSRTGVKDAPSDTWWPYDFQRFQQSHGVRNFLFDPARLRFEVHTYNSDAIYYLHPDDLDDVPVINEHLSITMNFCLSA